MSSKLSCNRQAFTLIELLAALAVLSMLVVLLFNAFSSSSRIMALGSNQMEKNQVVRAVLQQISRDLERTAYSSAAVNLYQSAAASEVISGTGILTNTLYCLSTLTVEEEGNLLGTIASVGYRVTQVTLTNFGVPVNKWVLQRGMDAYVDPSTHPTDWWNYSVTNTTYWQTLSDNIVGVAFQFYASPLTPPVTTWSSTTIPNNLPTAIQISIWAIDSDSYNRALALDPSLSLTTAKNMLMNNVHQYTSRVFLPQSTQN